MELAGKTALITGGGSGIGRATAICLAQSGAEVVVADINLGNAQATTREIQDLGGKALAVGVDVADWSGVEAMAQEALNAFQKVDILVNNAGITGASALLVKSTKEDWDRVFAVHVGGTFHCTRHLLDQMIQRRNGRIISISSVAALTGQKGAVHYSAAKAAIIGFTKALAREVAPYGITVNAIAPGIIETPLHENISPKVIAKMLESSPIPRMGKPEEIGHLIAYLASDKASFITGQVISPNGGLYL